VKLVATRGSGDSQFCVIDTGEVESTSGLHLAQVETEWPCKGWEIFENVVWEICTMHFGNDCVMIDIRCFLEKSYTVNVERGFLKCEFGVPIITRGLTRNEVERLHWMVEVA